MTVLMTQAMSFRKARSVNATDAAFPSRVPVAAEPVGDAGTATGQATVDLLARGVADGRVQNLALIVPFAEAGDGDTFSVRAVGWRRVGSDPDTDLWVPVTLGEFACTAGAATGVAGTPVLDTERFCDTIARVGTSGTDASGEVVSPADDTIAHVVLDCKGCQKLELTFDSTAAGTTGMNALVALL